MVAHLQPLLRGSFDSLDRTSSGTFVALQTRQSKLELMAVSFGRSRPGAGLKQKGSVDTYNTQSALKLGPELQRWTNVL